jgi:hypothetical protein
MSELLKAAIADAKAVRATALANAKAALEEAFTPKLQSMLSAKLQQEINDDEAEQAPVAPATEPALDAAPAALPHDDAAQDAAQAPLDVVPPAPDAEAAPLAPVVGDEEESLEEYQPLGSGNPDSVDQNQVGLFEDEKSNSLSKSPAGAKTKDELGKSKVVPASKKTGEDTPNGEPKEKTLGKVTVKREVSSAPKDPQGASNEVSKGMKKTDTGTSALTEVDDVEIDDASLDEILKELEDEVNLAQAGQVAEPALGTSPTAPAAIAPSAQMEVAPAAPAPMAPAPAGMEDEEINLDELLESDDKDADDKDDDKDDKKEDKEDRGNKAPWMKENISLKAELAEYRSTVTYLRDRINEVNLLNAKLLYTNKLFKSNSMTNEQKLRVIESFDLTKSVREAKLVYATLSESLNFGVKTVKPTSSTKTSTVKSITEGLASKPVASTKPTKPAGLLTEGAEMASRFQKLAGIKTK